MADETRPRIYLRELTSGDYGLEEFRKEQLTYDRLRADDLDTHGEPFKEPAGPVETMAPWRVGPGDQQLLTQSIQLHFRNLAPGGKSPRHGHQNEAVFYIAEGAGYDIDDEIRYEFQTGDTLLVHTDSVHQHFNTSDTEWTKIVVFKAKSLWMMLGLVEQGHSKSQPDDLYEPPEPWGDIWTPGVQELRKVIGPKDGEWEDDPKVGRVRRILDKNHSDRRCFSIDLVEQIVEPGEASIEHRHMADEAVYVLEGEGVSTQRDVRSEIDTTYHSRVAKTAREWPIKAGDVVYVPHNCIHQFRATGEQPLRFLSAQNRMFRHLGYDAIAVR